MFDDVSGRYDLLNRMMTLGQDAPGARTSPAPCRRARHGARPLHRQRRLAARPYAARTAGGRLDVSAGMLRGRRGDGGTGWAPRLACGDAFHLPLRDAARRDHGRLRARNLRPPREALAEMRRVLAPGGTSPCSRPARRARAGVRTVLRRLPPPRRPAAGRLDPLAYRYLSDSIFDFGPRSPLRGGTLAGAAILAAARARRPPLARPDRGGGGSCGRTRPCRMHRRRRRGEGTRGRAAEMPRLDGLRLGQSGRAVGSLVALTVGSRRPDSVRAHLQELARWRAGHGAERGAPRPGGGGSAHSRSEVGRCWQCVVGAPAVRRLAGHRCVAHALPCFLGLSHPEDGARHAIAGTDHRDRSSSSPPTRRTVATRAAREGAAERASRSPSATVPSLVYTANRQTERHVLRRGMSKPEVRTRSRCRQRTARPAAALSTGRARRILADLAEGGRPAGVRASRRPGAVRTVAPARSVARLARGLPPPRRGALRGRGHVRSSRCSPPGPRWRSRTCAWPRTSRSSRSPTT